MRFKARLPRLLLVTAFLPLAGCGTLGYYEQSVSGHLRLMAAREPIDEVVQSSDAGADVRRKLEFVRKVRAFASSDLALPDNRSYRYFTQLDRPYVVWNVVATPYDSLAPKQWCFPVAGCVSYRGYFHRADAEAFAAKLHKKGFDVAVLGASAYSTLGWFADPVVSSMLDYPDPELAGLIFHELAHERLYVKGDTMFNESFASTVEKAGVRRWLSNHGEPGQIEAWRRRRVHREAFTALLMKTRRELAALYERQGAQARLTLRLHKAAIFDRLKRRYRAISKDWNEPGRDAWMARDLNNAHLALVAAYSEGVPAFERLLECENGDFAGFYSLAETISGWPAKRRDAWMRKTGESTDCQAARP